MLYSFCVADRLDVDHTVGLPNFDNLLTSFLLVFQVNTYTTANGNELYIQYNWKLSLVKTFKNW